LKSIYGHNCSHNLATGAELVELAKAWLISRMDSALWGCDAIHLPAAWLALVKSSRPINEGSAVPMHRAHRSSTERV
jgi:hypothetical protein